MTRVVRDARHDPDHLPEAVGHLHEGARRRPHHPIAGTGEQVIPLSSNPLPHSSGPVGVSVGVRPHDPDDRAASDERVHGSIAWHDDGDHTDRTDTTRI